MQADYKQTTLLANLHPNTYFFMNMFKWKTIQFILKNILIYIIL